MAMDTDSDSSAEAMEVEDQDSVEEKTAPVLRLYVGGLPPSTGELELRECLGRGSARAVKRCYMAFVLLLREKRVVQS